LRDAPEERGPSQVSRLSKSFLQGLDQPLLRRQNGLGADAVSLGRAAHRDISWGGIGPRTVPRANAAPPTQAKQILHPGALPALQKGRAGRAEEQQAQPRG